MNFVLIARAELIVPFFPVHPPHQEGLVLMADEVYQENIWRPDRPFVSFRKVR